MRSTRRSLEVERDIRFPIEKPELTKDEIEEKKNYTFVRPRPVLPPDWTGVPEDYIQWMAEDVDNNGVIQAKDAWLINNYVVNKSDANSQVGSWDFVDRLADFDKLGMRNTTLDNDNLNNIALTDQNRTFNMTSFIHVDVNGSFASKLS